MKIDKNIIKELSNYLDEFNLTEIEITEKDTKIKVSKNNISISNQPAVTSTVLNNENITILSLWATWCVPCIKELDAINEVYEFWKEDIDFNLIAVSVDDSRSHRRAQALVNGKEWPYKILLDVNQDFKRALGTSFIPQTLIIKNGKILYQHTGYQPGDENYLFEKLTEYEN